MSDGRRRTTLQEQMQLLMSMIEEGLSLRESPSEMEVSAQQQAATATATAPSQADDDSDAILEAPEEEERPVVEVRPARPPPMDDERDQYRLTEAQRRRRAARRDHPRGDMILEEQPQRGAHQLEINAQVHQPAPEPEQALVPEPGPALVPEEEPALVPQEQYQQQYYQPRIFTLRRHKFNNRYHPFG